MMHRCYVVCECVTRKDCGPADFHQPEGGGFRRKSTARQTVIIYMYMHAYIHACIEHACMHTSTYARTQGENYILKSRNMSVYVCIFLCIYIYIYMYMYE